MDILCTRCGEPWDLCSLNEDMDPHEKGRLLRGEGCPCCYGKPLEGDTKMRADATHEARLAQEAMQSVLGDDLDGLAAGMEDFGFV